MPTVKTDILEIHCLTAGSQDGWPVILTHGFPYSPSVYDKVIPTLVEAGAYVITPYVRGYGPTKFLSPDTIRSGQQAALATDLIALLDGLKIKSAILAGFDWGGLASCTAAALFPNRVEGMVCSGGYDVIDVASGSTSSGSPELQRTMWYQHLFQHERGRKCLEVHRRELCEMLWKEWSPGFEVDSKLFEDAATAFENDDFVDVITSHYRHAMDNFAGNPRYQALEAQLATKPKVVVPSITMDGSKDPLKPGGTEKQTIGMFTSRHEHWTLDCGHAVPMEVPDDFAKAVLLVRKWTEEMDK